MISLACPIPEAATEVVGETWETGDKKSASYLLDGQRVGYRSWNQSGQLDMEYGVKDDRQHGLFRTWHDNGQVQEIAWYENGKEHGTTKQYDADGTLVGTYTMVDGTGIDLWFMRPGVVSEERHYHDGLRHGYERWWNEDNTTIGEESHFWQGVEHGVFRQWNRTGRLRRGYPRYFVSGQRVTKRQYIQAARHDSTLPAFVMEENLPIRHMPEEVQQQM